MQSRYTSECHSTNVHQPQQQMQSFPNHLVLPPYLVQTDPSSKVDTSLPKMNETSKSELRGAPPITKRKNLPSLCQCLIPNTRLAALTLVVWLCFLGAQKHLDCCACMCRIHSKVTQKERQSSSQGSRCEYDNEPQVLTAAVTRVEVIQPSNIDKHMARHSAPYT